ncbi:MAG: hypothetical protein LBP87_06360 [Planctomycetaceae bacterium]|jgi:hypothetical protein|nr:hypothetical protein [Planctomycetaceae bacterium]
MSETIVQDNHIEIQTPTSITQGDRSSRVWLKSRDGTATLNLADDIFNKCLLAGEIEYLANKASQQKQLFHKEYELLNTLIDKWLSDHADQIIKEKTGIVSNFELSTSGKIHLRFIVTKKDPIDWISDPLEMELVNLEERLLREFKFEIIRLNSILVPNAEE